MTDVQTETATWDIDHPIRRALDESQADLWELRRWLRDNPGIAGNLWGLKFTVDSSTWDDDKREFAPLSIAQVASIVRAMSKGQPKGKVRKDTSDSYMTYSLRFTYGKARIDFHVPRNSVCVAKVVGTKTISVPNSDPTSYVTKDVDEVEWECLPLLAEAEKAGDSDDA